MVSVSGGFALFDQLCLIRGLVLLDLGSGRELVDQVVLRECHEENGIQALGLTAFSLLNLGLPLALA